MDEEFFDVLPARFDLDLAEARFRETVSEVYGIHDELFETYDCIAGSRMPASFSLI
jgi:hypothetical protein